MRLSHVVSKALDLSAAGVVARISCRTMSRITSTALRIKGLFGRCAEVAMDRGGGNVDDRGVEQIHDVSCQHDGRHDPAQPVGLRARGSSSSGSTHENLQIGDQS